MESHPKPLITLTQSLDILLNFPSKLFWIFRGQTDASWNLVPRAGRQPFYKSSKPVDPESQPSYRNPPPDLGRFNLWRKLAVGYTDKLPDNDFECLAYAQHYGLPTRLLDWTENSLAALYFACEGDFDKDGAVFAYFPSSFIDESNKSIDIYSFNHFACLRVRPFDRRLLAQRAAFLFFPNPSAGLEAKNIPEADMRAELRVRSGGLNLLKFKIPAEAKLIIHRQLVDVGVTRRTLFPDLDGLSQEFVWESLYLEAFKKSRVK